MSRCARALTPLLFFALTASLSTAHPAPAQAASSQASPAPGNTTSQPATTSPAPAATIHVSSQLVVVDVVVTDSSHKPVHGLTAADFTLKENGVAQTVKNFEEHSALTPAEATKLQPVPPMPPDVFTNYNPAPANGSVDLLLLDTLNTPITDQTFARQQLLAYLKSIPPGTRIAIFGLSQHLYILQGFTSDPAALRAALEHDHGAGSPLLDDEVGGNGVQESQADHLEDDSYANSDLINDLRQFEAEQQSFEVQVRVKYTLDAFNQLARYLANIPGRKNLIWFSGSFPVSILPDSSGTLNDPFAVAANFEDEFRQAVDLLGRSQVAVYPVDARGLTNSPVFDVSTKRVYTGAKGNRRFAQDQNKFITDTNNEHGTMQDMAYSTGGQAFVNTNDLTHAVADAIDQGSNFYSLAYTPADSNMDGKLRKIKIESARGGLTLSYRQGYYADPPDKTVTGATLSASTPPGQAATNGLSSRDTLRLAMMRGAPAPSDIVITAGVVPTTPGAPPEDAPAPYNMPSQKEPGPWRRYNVNYQINPADIVFFHGPDNKVHADFELIIFVYSADGTVLNMLDNAVHIADSMDNIRQTLKQGIICHEQISAPAKGQSFLRIAVHDLHRDHYGAVEVATSQVKDIGPAQPEPAAAPPAAPATGTQK